MELPIELYQEILDRADFLSQIRLTQLSRYLYINLNYLRRPDILVSYCLHLFGTSSCHPDNLQFRIYKLGAQA